MDGKNVALVIVFGVQGRYEFVVDLILNKMWRSCSKADYYFCNDISMDFFVFCGLNI